MQIKVYILKHSFCFMREARWTIFGPDRDEEPQQ